MRETIHEVDSHQAKYASSFCISVMVHEGGSEVGRVVVHGGKPNPDGYSLHAYVRCVPRVAASAIAEELIDSLGREPDKLTICRYEVQNMSQPGRKLRAFGWDGKRLL